MHTPGLPFQNSAGTVSYVPAGYVRLAWTPRASSDADLRAIYEQGLAAMQRYGATRIMSVHTERQPISQAVQQWVLTSWIPRVEALAPPRAFAVVLAASPISRLASRSMTSQLGQTISHREFDTEAGAEHWLLH
jgi:hypothetical protein